MVARPFRCDPSRLRLLLEDRLSDDDQAALAGHLEDCASCRRGLESLAAESRWWGDARLLRGEEPPSPTAGRDPTEGPALDFLAPPDDPEHLGRLGPYEVTEVVGKGGMGVVLKAIDPLLNRTVAIKVLAPELATSATARRRFAREAQAAAAVAHEHIVAIYAVDATPGGLPYLVMPYVAGKSLQERLDRSGPLEVREVLRVGMQAAAGLAAAHAQGLVHRDVKPANILLENCVERVKLTDFGLARAADDASLTQSGVVAGTPQYMAPEQTRGEPVDARADLFSLGSVLYALCTGRPPFRAETTMGVLRRVCDDAPRPIRETSPDVPGWLAAIIARLHAKDPADRYQTAAEVAELLGRCLAHLEQPDRVPPPFEPERPSSRRRVGGWAVAALALVVTVAGLGASEAAGLTKLADFVATVLRIRTPHGTLVVDVQDPEVKVQVDGEELVLTGAGPQEVRLKLGDHTVQATKGGVPVLEKLVSLSRGGKETVTVSREPETGRAAASRKGAAGRQEGLQVELDALQESYTRLSRVAISPHDPALQHLRERIKKLEVELQQIEQEMAAGPPGEATRRELAGTDLGTRPDSDPQADLKRLQARVKELEAELAKRDRAARGGMGERPAAGPARRDGMPSSPGPEAFAPGSNVYGIAVSPDGKTLALACEDGAIRLYRLPDRKLLSRINGHSQPVRAVAFSPDGKVLASGSGDYRAWQQPGEVKLWDADDGRALRDLEGHSAMVWSLAFSPDGKALATASDTARLWDAATGRLRASLGDDRGGVRCVAFSPDGKALAVSDFKGRVRLWDTGAGAERRTIEAHEGGVSCVAFSPDGKTLATSGLPAGGFRPGTVVLWDASSGRERARLKGHRDPVFALAFSPDGRWLASGGGVYIGQDRGEVLVWDLATGRIRLRITEMKHGVGSLAFTPDGEVLISGGGVPGADGEVLLWEFRRFPVSRGDDLPNPGSQSRPKAPNPNSELGVGERPIP
jgi:eukaryotic-like serine/threonine-protein kinase